jgi:plasmid stabilization system protein ParE
LNTKRVLFTATARKHVDREHAWWREHRDYTDVFATELEAAIQLLTVLPGAGTPYPRSPIPGVRRIYLGKIACHLYYTFDEDQVIVRALWGARRERGPELG